MSARLPLIALVAAILLLAGLAGTGDPVGERARTEELRAADGALLASASLRVRVIPARRDRVPAAVDASLAPSGFELAPPARRAVAVEGPDRIAGVPTVEAARPRSRAPPWS